MPNSGRDEETLCVFVGRFQGFHKGHAKIVRRLLKEYLRVVIFVVEGEKTSADRTKNSFSGETRASMIKECHPEAAVFVVPNGFIPGSIKFLGLWRGREKVLVAAGKDRGEGYLKQFVGCPYEAEILRTKRPKGMSGSAMREALAKGDFDAYRKISARGINNKKWWNKLRSELTNELAQSLPKTCGEEETGYPRRLL